MADPFGIVLVPTDAGRALTALGPCGARPPTVVNYATRGPGSPWRPNYGIVEPLTPTCRIGLPVWWGVLVDDGRDRARRVLWSVRPSTSAWVLASEMAPTVAQARALALVLESYGLCHVVQVAAAEARERAP